MEIVHLVGGVQGLKRFDNWAWVERVASQLIKSQVLTHIQVLKSDIGIFPLKEVELS